MLKAALFDLDGTLIDTEGQYTEIWAQMGREYCPQIPDFAYVIKGTTLTQILQRYFPSPQLQQEVVARLYAFEQQMHYEFYPHAEEFLHDLHSHGVRCAVVTSSNRQKMTNVRRQLPQFDSLFDLELTSEDFHASKPDPDCYLTAARTLGCTTDECVVFEDAITGLQSGMAAGMYTIGLATTNPRERIENLCNCVIDGYEEVLGKLRFPR